MIVVPNRLAPLFRATPQTRRHTGARPYKSHREARSVEMRTGQRSSTVHAAIIQSHLPPEEQHLGAVYERGEVEEIAAQAIRDSITVKAGSLLVPTSAALVPRSVTAQYGYRTIKISTGSKLSVRVNRGHSAGGVVRTNSGP